MAERVAERWAGDAGLDVSLASAGVSDEERGHPMDLRARLVLDAHGYRSGGHRARRITRSEIESADLVIAAEPFHVDRMRRAAPSVDTLALLSDFDPDADPGSGVPDPWYGGPEGFEDTLDAIESAMPGVLSRIRELQEK